MVKEFITPQQEQIEVRTRKGESFMVNTSNEACEKFGFRAHDTIRVKESGRLGNVIGIAPHVPNSPDGIDALWVELHGETGACFFLTRKRT